MTRDGSEGLRGTPRIPGDKSISHRYALLAGAGTGTCRISNYSSSQDCDATLRCLRELAVPVEGESPLLTIEGRGRASWKQPLQSLDAGNSGTLLRLLSGLLATLPFQVTITGDASLRSRPMKRICEPLEMMGARIQSARDFRPPLTIQGGRLAGISYRTPVASAQVKSCLLLAGLGASGRTRIQEPAPSRDHTERALPQFGVPVEINHGWIEMEPGELENPPELEVPGDFSAATFFILGALMVPNSRLLLKNVGVNPTRAALLKTLLSAEASIAAGNSRSLQNEPVEDLEVEYSPDLLRRFPSCLDGPVIPNLIDELPALAILGTQLARGLTVRDASELRRKECDRIQAVVENLQTLGVEAEEFDDGFHIPSTPQLRGGRVKTFGDHRIAMAFALAGLLTPDWIDLDDPDCVAVSFPDFFAEFRKIGGP